jgi:hypothetical protein
MKFEIILALAAASALISTASAAVNVVWLGPTDAPNSNANWPSALSTATYNQNFGVAFKTGPSGAYSMDWATIGLNTSAVSGGGSVSLKIALYTTNNDTAYSAVAGNSSYAIDEVSFIIPATTSTSFDLDLTAADIPNISSYEMAADTAYALILYAPSRNIGLQRRTGYTNGTTNNMYTVSSGFSALDTLRNNTANYSNNANSFPTLDISFGANAVPEPASMVLSMLAGGMILIRRKR